jgi:hypothetical protein
MFVNLVRRFAVSAAILALLLAFPASAGATITGGCTGEGHSTSGGANLTTDSEWHLKSNDVAGGSATAPAAMRSATVAAYGLGIGIPIAGGTSEDGETSGSVDGVNVSTYAVLGHRFVVAGSASGDGQCTGQIEIVIDDNQPLLTVLGGGGIVLALIGVIGMLAQARGSGGFVNRFLSAVFGAMAGLGAALALEQFEALDPTQPFGLFILVGLAVVGFITAGMFRSGTPAPAPTSPM